MCFRFVALTFHPYNSFCFLSAPLSIVSTLSLAYVSAAGNLVCDRGKLPHLLSASHCEEKQHPCRLAMTCMLDLTSRCFNMLSDDYKTFHGQHVGEHMDPTEHPIWGTEGPGCPTNILCAYMAACSHVAEVPLMHRQESPYECMCTANKAHNEYQWGPS
jgi:hypothetical protein